VAKYKYFCFEESALENVCKEASWNFCYHPQGASNIAPTFYFLKLERNRIERKLECLYWCYCSTTNIGIPEFATLVCGECKISFYDVYNLN
jgi:hypothetical protein